MIHDFTHLPVYKVFQVESAILMENIPKVKETALKVWQIPTGTFLYSLVTIQIKVFWMPEKESYQKNPNSRDKYNILI